MPERDRSHLAIAMISIALLAFATYSDILDYGFTGSDTLPLIATGRLQSWHDLGRIVTEPLMGGTGFEERGLFYRPVSTLSYGLDESLWGLAPRGYHLTDVLLHVLVTVLVFLVVRRLRNGRLGVAWLAAVIFTTHPILVESVPAISRRQDVLAALFLLLALLFHMRAVRLNRRRWTAAALAAYVLALGSKEVTVVLPFVILAHGTLFPSAAGGFHWRRGLRASLPFLAVTGVMMVWRIALLGRLGGIIDETWGPWRVLQSTVLVLRSYVGDLILPVNLLPVAPEQLIRAAMPVVTVAAGVTLIVIAVSWFRGWPRADENTSSLSRALRSGTSGLALLAAAALAAAPWLLPSGTATYRGAMAWSALLLVLLMALLLLAVVHFRAHLRRWLFENEQGRWVVFFLFWMPPFLLMMVLTHGFSHRSMYIMVIPFSAVLAMTLADGWHAVRGDRRPASATAGRNAGSWRPVRNALRLALPAGLAGYLLFFSPLVRTYPEWRESAGLADAFFERLGNALVDAPRDAVLQVYGLPSGFTTDGRRLPYARSVSFPSDYTIKSWLDLHRPGHAMSVHVHGAKSVPGFDGHLDLTTRRRGLRDLRVDVKLGRVAG